MNLIGLLFVLVAHYLCGAGALKLCNMQHTGWQRVCLAMMVGIFIVSLAPCLLQLAHLSITVYSVYAAIAALVILFCLPLLYKFRRPSFHWPGLPAFYEWPLMAALLLLVIVSVWRCYYYPPTARDMLTGPELIAEYTVRERTMINSVYSIDLSTTNNHFKSPFITGLQIVYKLLVCPFGQVWLSALFVAFTLWLYIVLRNTLHPLLAAMLALVFVATPTMYGYTYILLYDYSNMVFFVTGYWFLTRDAAGKGRADMLMADLLMGIATYIRTETLVLIAMLLPAIVVLLRSGKLSITEIVARCGLFMLIPVVCYFVCMQVFVRNFVPVTFDLHGQFNTSFGHVRIFFDRLSQIAEMLFSGEGITLYGYLVLLFCVVVLTDVLWVRKSGKETAMLLYGVLAVVIGYAVLGYLFPQVVDMGNTTKRGLFKAIGLMTLYICSSGSMRRCSAWIGRLETATWQARAQRVRLS